MPVDSFSGMLPEEWDAARPMRRRPSALIAADDIARLERANGELQAALEEALGRVAALEEALEPFAKLDAQPSLTDNALTSQYVRAGDVRRAGALLGGDGAR